MEASNTRGEHDLNRIFSGLLAAIAIAVAVFPGDARVLRVPGDHPTIGATLEAAEDGDLVRVWPGTYVEDRLSFGGKNIVVAGLDHLDPKVVTATVITADTSLHDRNVVFENGEDSTAALVGISIRVPTTEDDWPYYLGGVRCVDSSPTIAYCRISRSLAAGLL